jgi:molecular chaperone DnaK (HSP70)
VREENIKADRNCFAFIGVDFGTLKTVIAVARNRGVDVVSFYSTTLLLLLLLPLPLPRPRIWSTPRCSHQEQR